MAAMATQAALPGTIVGREFQGLKASTSFSRAQTTTLALPSLRCRGKGALGARCGFIGSPTNLIMVACTTLSLIAGRFGLAPSANRQALAGLKLVDRDSGLQTGDPAGFTGSDTVAFGVVGHIAGVGIVLGLKALGSIP
ncbi:photosystem I reaction center subunit psaK, chloroplastic [Selaginella moellendorffii]|uniref:photosystem I reaction center subunit psaK, chloroplastic n=1 Tax=Selaginella moellendorffii TaxID=88036 RepID=UPI000D1C9755|nr:photosystem I reaction center subunit psaK, chloroplastic [Selaginella moellendorffii]|eukprot:XP_002981605.2 photosystem I reaction center subunit psaK, chloroplastic [Selaginella moellendorffii]